MKEKLDPESRASIVNYRLERAKKLFVHELKHLLTQ